MQSVADFCLKLIEEERTISKSNIMPLGSIPDMSIIAIFDYLANRLNYQLKPTISDINSPCTYVDSSNAKLYGYLPPLTSEALKYWLDEESFI